MPLLVSSWRMRVVCTLLVAVIASCVDDAMGVQARHERRVQLRTNQQTLRASGLATAEAGEGWWWHSDCNKRVAKSWYNRKSQTMTDSRCQACLIGDLVCSYVVASNGKAACRQRHKIDQTVQSGGDPGGTVVNYNLCCSDITQKTTAQRQQCNTNSERAAFFRARELLNVRQDTPAVIRLAVGRIGTETTNMQDQGRRRAMEDALIMSLMTIGTTASRGGDALELLTAIQAGSEIATFLETTATATEVAVPVGGVVLGFISDGLAYKRGRNFREQVLNCILAIETAADELGTDHATAQGSCAVLPPVPLSMSTSLLLRPMVCYVSATNVFYAALHGVWMNVKEKVCVHASVRCCRTHKLRLEY